MALPNPKNYTSAAAADLGLAGMDMSLASADEEERKKRMLQRQREQMGLTGVSVYGAASMSLFGDARV